MVAHLVELCSFSLNSSQEAPRQGDVSVLLRSFSLISLQTEAAFDKIIRATKKTTKFLTVDIQEEHFSYTRNEDAIQKAKQLDGLYAIHSILQLAPKAAGLEVDYKRLSAAQLAFRTMKRNWLQVRPIHQRTIDRVATHVFL